MTSGLGRLFVAWRVHKHYEQCRLVFLMLFLHGAEITWFRDIINRRRKGHVIIRLKHQHSQSDHHTPTLFVWPPRNDSPLINTLALVRLIALLYKFVPSYWLKLSNHTPTEPPYQTLHCTVTKSTSLFALTYPSIHHFDWQSLSHHHALGQNPPHFWVHLQNLSNHCNDISTDRNLPAHKVRCQFFSPSRCGRILPVLTHWYVGKQDIFLLMGSTTGCFASTWFRRSFTYTTSTGRTWYMRSFTYAASTGRDLVVALIHVRCEHRPGPEWSRFAAELTCTKQ